MYQSSTVHLGWLCQADYNTGSGTKCSSPHRHQKWKGPDAMRHRNNIALGLINCFEVLFSISRSTKQLLRVAWVPLLQPWIQQHRPAFFFFFLFLILCITLGKTQLNQD